MSRIVIRTSCRAVVSAMAALVAMLVVGCGGPREPDTYSWRGQVGPGSQVQVRNVNGAVRVGRATGSEVVVRATKSYRGRRAEPVRLVTERRGDDLRICAAYGRSAESCDDRSGPNLGFVERLLRNYSRTQMEIVVALPAGARLDASTVNGSVTVADGGDVSASTTNGSVTVAASGGPVRARSVNGSIVASVGSLAPGAEVTLTSVNGSVSAMVPRTLNAAVDLGTTNGRLASDFPLGALTARTHRVHAVLGAGGTPVVLRTVNGSVRLEAQR